MILSVSGEFVLKSHFSVFGYFPSFAQESALSSSREEIEIDVIFSYRQVTFSYRHVTDHVEKQAFQPFSKDKIAQWFQTQSEDRC